MKKFIFLGLLTVSSFVFSDYHFTTNGTYCTNPNYSEAEFFNEANGTNGMPYFSVLFKRCYHDGKELTGGPFRIFGMHINPRSYFTEKSYEKLMSVKFPYLFFRDGIAIYVSEMYDDEARWMISLKLFPNAINYYNIC